MDMDDARKLLQSRAGGRLFDHSRGVEESACKLALTYGVDSAKASLAGLLHDYGKIYPHNVLRQIALEHSLGDELALQEPKLLHAPVGAWLLRHELGIEDEEILAAVRVHTTGAAGISPLARIVYLADYIEPGRAYPGVDDLRKTAFVNLDRALLDALTRTIKYVLEREKVLHPDSISFRNSLILS
ncbi:MAG: bis(5'-nucleosyl)-tetraphosphatase (symmetrical) YqeK [Dethiobacteria bacterium]|jgi:predicted HD superfamily hydrolase involved in NAD metabolism